MYVQAYYPSHDHLACAIDSALLACTMQNQNQRYFPSSPSFSDTPQGGRPGKLDPLGNPTPPRTADASSIDNSLIADVDVALRPVVTGEDTRCQQIVTCYAKFVDHTLSACDGELQQAKGLFTGNRLLFRDVTLSDYDTIRHNIRDQPGYCNITYVHTTYLHDLLTVR
jgi:hypothetical protein